MLNKTICKTYIYYNAVKVEYLFSPPLSPNVHLLAVGGIGFVDELTFVKKKKKKIENLKTIIFLGPNPSIDRPLLFSGLLDYPFDETLA